MMTLIDVLKRTEEFFRQKKIASPRLDAEILISHVLSLNRVQLYMEFEKPLSSAELDQIRPLVARRGKREPVAYILGSKGFHEHDFIVLPGTLCPRPDTETLVEEALKLIAEDEELFIADVGCGTGCVGLSIAAARKEVKLYSTDVSDTAIKCTRKNIHAMGLEKRAAVLKGSLLSPIPEERRIDIVVSNPPYIPSADIQTLEPEVRTHEPIKALDGGKDGLEIYRELIPDAALRACKAVLLEVGAGQSAEVERLMTAEGLIQVRSVKDLGGISRVVIGLKQN